MKPAAAVTVVIGGALGWATDSAPLLILAFFALMLLLWADAHDPRRWEES